MSFIRKLLACTLVAGAIQATGSAFATTNVGLKKASMPLKCGRPQSVPKDLRRALREFYETSLPPSVERPEVCVSSRIHHGTYDFRVVVVRNVIWCNARGACHVEILGRTRGKPYVNLAPPVLSFFENSMTVQTNTGAPQDYLEIRALQGAFRWNPKTERFDYFTNEEIEKTTGRLIDENRQRKTAP